MLFNATRLVFISCLLFCAEKINAQKDFEGIIRYKASPDKYDVSDGEAKDSMVINIWFTPGRILIRNNKSGDMEQEDILVILDSAKVYTIDLKEKTYRVKKIKISKPETVASKEIIAGYPTTPLQLNTGGMTKMGGNVVVWYADDLFFHVPPQYEDNEELMMVKNDRIMLKMVMKMDDYGYGGYEDEDENEDEMKLPRDESVLTITAVEVIPRKMNPSDFMIPPGFTKAISIYPSLSDTDSVMMSMDTAFKVMTDTVAVKDEPAKAPSTPSKKPVKKPVKSTGSNKSGIRKED